MTTMTWGMSVAVTTSWVAVGGAGVGLCAVLAQSVARHLMALLSTFVEVSMPLGLVAAGVALLTVVGAAFVRAVALVPRPTMGATVSARLEWESRERQIQEAAREAELERAAGREQIDE